MLPPTLEAAEHVELPTPDERSLEQAMRAWRAVDDHEDAAALADVVAAWWQTYRENEVPVRIALGSLDRMLSEVATVENWQ